MRNPSPDFRLKTERAPEWQRTPPVLCYRRACRYVLIASALIVSLTNDAQCVSGQLEFVQLEGSRISELGCLANPGKILRMGFDFWRYRWVESVAIAVIVVVMLLVCVNAAVHYVYSTNPFLPTKEVSIFTNHSPSPQIKTERPGNPYPQAVRNKPRHEAHSEFSITFAEVQDPEGKISRPRGGEGIRVT